MRTSHHKNICFQKKSLKGTGVYFSSFLLGMAILKSKGFSSPRKGTSYKFILILPPIRPSICMSLTIFVDVCPLVFSKILHSNRNLEREKSGRSWLSKKFLLSLKWTNRVPNRVLLSLKFCRYFLLEDKIKDLPVLCSSANPISGKVVLHKVYGEMLLSKTLPDSLIISISGSKTILILCIYIFTKEW